MNEVSGLALARRGFLLILSRSGLVTLAGLLLFSNVIGTRPTNVGARPTKAPAISISFCDAPTVLPRNTPLATYSPELCFAYSGLGQEVYTLKAWLLETQTGNFFCGNPTIWCERIFPIDNSSGANPSGSLIVVQNTDVNDYNGFRWVIRLYNQAGAQVAFTEQSALSTTNRAPVLNPIGNKSGNSGVPLQFTVSASDVEGDALGLSAQNLPPGATFNAVTGAFNWPSPVSGNYSSIIFKATQTGSIPLSDAELINIQIDAPNQVLSLSSSAYTTGEGGPAMIIVNRTSGSVGTVSVDYATSSLTATSGSDYTATSGTLTFPDGVVTAAIGVPIINDTTPESNETFSVSLSNPTGNAVLGTATGTVTIVDDDTPSVSGQWGPLIPWQTLPIHMHLLPSGKVMFWDRHDDPGTPMGWDGHPWLWDPATQGFSMLQPPPNDVDIFCSGHTFMPDGKLIVAGGHHMANNVGESAASVYDPVTNTWTSLPNMNGGRWYPTCTPLANGDILVLAGTRTAFNDINPLPQVWQTASGTWRNLTTATFHGIAPDWPDYYPFLFLAPNGKVFDAGPQQISRYLDTSGTGLWTDVASSHLIYRDYGSAAMYADGKVVMLGGNPRLPDDPNTLPSASAEVIDLNASTPAWRLISPMSVGRRHVNTTLLPDGQILVTGGSSFAGADNPAGKVLYAEMWNPATETWTIVAGYTRYRGYHSNAVLLPDARVLVAGGGHPNPPTGAEQNAEIYSPPYLFKGARPAISSAPAQVTYGQTFLVETPDPQSIAKVTWIRPASVTHAFNENQRINQLTFSQTTGGLLVTAPSGANLCPPGDYMLFVLNGNGVPSVARFVRVSASLPARTLTVASSNPASGVSVTITPNDNNGQGNGVTQLTRIYNDSSVVNLTAVSTAGGNTFQKWQRDGVDFAVTTSTDVTMDANHTMTAIYVATPPARTLTVASSNPSSGVSITVSPNDNNAQGDGVTQFTRVYNNNVVVMLTAPSTAGGNTFQKWLRDGADFAATTATNVTMDANHTMTAVYVTTPPTRTLTVVSSNPSSGVSVTVSPNDNNAQGNGVTQFTRVYNNNVVVALTAPATAAGNTFQKWLRDGVDFAVTASTNVTMDVNHTMTAIYVTSGQTVLLDETFSGGIPATWSVINGGSGGGTAATWTTANPGNRTIGGAFFTAPFAIIDSDSAGQAATQDEQLITPAINASACAGRVVVEFGNQFFWYDQGQNEVADVDVSTNGGSTWVNVHRMQREDNGYPIPIRKTIDITSAIGSNRSNVKIRFHYYNAGFEWWWAIDNVKVKCVSGPPHNASTTGVFRPSNGALYLKNSNTTGFADVAITYGSAGDYPVTGDWNGDGIDTIGVYRNGTFYLRNSNTLGFGDIVVAFGQPGDQPIVGDWDGDGIDTIGVFRNGNFMLRNSNTPGPPDIFFGLGGPGDVAIAGDWDGDGIDTTGVYRPSNGALYLKFSNTTGFADLVLTYGSPGDKPIVGDWDGDGVDTIGIYRFDTFFLRNSNSNGFADIVFTLGSNGDMPIAGDWDGLP